MKSRTMKATLAFLTAASAVVGFTGTTSAANIEGQTYSFSLAGSNVPAGGGDSDATGNVAGKVVGTNLEVTAFLNNVDVDSVVMHFHTGETCDAGGGIAVDVTGVETGATGAEAVEIIDNRFVLTKTVPLGSADMENVYFNVHEAGNLGNVIACGELDASADPLLIDGTGQSRSTSFGSNNANTLNGTDVVMTGGVTLEGNKLAVNLVLTGDDLLDGNNRVVTLRNNNSCDASSDTFLTNGIIRSLTSQGLTDPPSADYDLLTVLNNSAWGKNPGATVSDPAGTEVNTTIILTPEEVAAYGDMTIIVHGNESNSDETVLDAPLNLQVKQAQPVACGQLGVGDTTGALNGNYYSLDFKEIGNSGYSGKGSLKNTTAGGPASVEANILVNAPASASGVHKVTLDEDATCDDTTTIGWSSIAPDLLGNGTDQIDINTGVLRSIFGPLQNTGTFTGGDADKVNDGDFTVLITDESKATVLACAQLSRTFDAPPETPDAPVAFNGTVQEATSIEQIQAATDFKANADNTGDHQTILRLYTAFFNRTPDVEGVKFWIGEFDAGKLNNTLEVANNFTPQQEFINAFGTVPDEDFVATVYQNVLDREPEAEGLAYWTDILNGTNNSGNNEALSKAANRGELVYYVAINQEFINRLPYAPAG